MKIRLLLTLAAVVVLVHGLSASGGFHYDDEHSVADNPHIRSLQQIPRFFVDPATFSLDAERGMYRPMLLTSYTLDHAVHGGSARGYLWTNLLLHALNATLVAWVAWQLTGRSSLALLAGALFGLHPAASEPVYYVSARSDSLVALFFLATTGLWMCSGERRGWSRYGAWLTGAAALWTKATAIVLPVVLFSLDVVRRQTPRSASAWLRRYALWGGLVGFYLSCIWWVQFLPRSLAAAPRDLLTQLLTQAKAAIWYVHLFCWPVGGSVHPAFSVAPEVSAVVVLCALLTITITLVGVGLWRTGFRRHLFLGVWVGAALLPTTIMPLNVLVNERRAYLPIAAFAIALAWGLLRLRRLPRSRGPVVAGLLLAFAMLSHDRGAVWASDLTLWQDAVQRGPFMARSRLYLGDAHVEAARNTQRMTMAQMHRAAARDAYEAVVQLNPAQRMLTLQAHNGLAILELNAGALEAAEQRLKGILAEHPDFVDALVNLGSVYYSRARDTRGADVESLRLATQLYGRALQLAPGRYEARLNLGAAYHLAGDLPRAQAEYEIVLAQAPDDGRAAFNLGTLYLQRSRVAPATTGETAVAATVWRQRALQLLERAVDLQPGDEQAQRALSAARAQGGR